MDNILRRLIQMCKGNLSCNDDTCKYALFRKFSDYSVKAKFKLFNKQSNLHKSSPKHRFIAKNVRVVVYQQGALLWHWNPILLTK